MGCRYDGLSLQNGRGTNMDSLLLKERTIGGRSVCIGVVCDGAKLACALRISSGTGIALEAADMALHDVHLANNQGVLDKTADDSINLLGHTALFSMVDSDRDLCRQLFAKRHTLPLMTFAQRQLQ